VEIPEFALQELRMRESHDALWYEYYDKTPEGDPRKQERFNSWVVAESRLYGARSMLVAIYGTEVTKLFVYPPRKG
jgi:hypothetical protein